MEITSAFNEYETLPSLKLVSDIGPEDLDFKAIMSKDSYSYQKRVSTSPSRDLSQSSRSSVCNEEQIEVDYVLFFGDSSEDNQNMVQFIPTEENVSDCPSFLDNVNQPSESNYSNTPHKGVGGELVGPNSRSIKRQMSSENYFRPAGEDRAISEDRAACEDQLSSAKRSPCHSGREPSMCLCKFDLPRKRAMSRPQLNTPDEIKFIEENVRINAILSNLRKTNSDDSFFSDDAEGFAMMEDSYENMQYSRITGEYPLLFHSPSDGSLIAVLDFDMSDELPECSYQHCSRCRQD